MIEVNKEEMNKEIEKDIKRDTDQAVKPVKKTKSITFKINSNVIMVFVLIILMIVSVAQAVELGNLKEKISTGEVKAATTGTDSSSGSSSTPANLKDLPSMVGGC